MLYQQFFNLCLQHPNAKVIAMRRQENGITDWTQVIEQLPRKKAKLFINAMYSTGEVCDMHYVGDVPNSFLQLAANYNLKYASLMLLTTTIGLDFIVCIG